MNPVPMTRIGLAGTIRWIAAIIAIIVALGLPLGYLALAYQFEAAAAKHHAEAHAVVANQSITAEPATWRFEVSRLGAIIATDILSGDELPEKRYILDERGTVLAQNEEVISPPILTRSAALLDAGREVGRFVVSRSLAPVLQNTGIAALISLALAIGVYISLNVLPLRALERALAERKSAERNLAYLANYDSLTGLPNRNLFHDRLRQTTFRAARNKRLVALLYVDLDQFKIVNDSLGHVVGDAVLKQVAQRVQEGVRKTDTVSRPELEQAVPGEHSNVTISRLGGDEFSVILEDVDSVEHTATVAQRILDAIARPFMVDDHEIFVTASMGITVYPNDGADLDNLVSGADAAMYQAKGQGRNNFQFFTSDMGARAKQRLEFEAALRRALEREEFSLYYQPKFNLGIGQVTGLEVLLRWSHPEFGSTAKFIPILEDTGLIVPVGEWMLRSACAQVKKWQAKGLPALRVSVNISARQFVREGLVADIGRILTDTGLEPGLLEVEMTESLLMVHTEASVAVLSALKGLGVHISVDDFGTGYSSLSYLKRFPVDVLKIDQSFVRDVTTDPDSAAIVRAIIALAHSLRLGTIAEGVETEAQLEYLREQGCAEIQGYLLSRPLPADAFEAWIAAGTHFSRSRPPATGNT